MPNVVTETAGTGNIAWLGSAHGVGNCQTVTLDPAGFTAATDYPGGFIPSGTPLTVTDGVAAPFTTGGTLSGFLLTDQPINGTGTIGVPLLDHGRVILNRLPKAVTADVTTTGVFVFVGA